MDSWYQNECAGNVQDQNCANVVYSWAMYMWFWGAITETKGMMPWFLSQNCYSLLKQSSQCMV